MHESQTSTLDPSDRRVPWTRTCRAGSSTAESSTMARIEVFTTSCPSRADAFDTNTETSRRAPSDTPTTSDKSAFDPLTRQRVKFRSSPTRTLSVMLFNEAVGLGPSPVNTSRSGPHPACTLPFTYGRTAEESLFWADGASSEAHARTPVTIVTTAANVPTMPTVGPSQRRCARSSLVGASSVTCRTPSGGARRLRIGTVRSRSASRLQRTQRSCAEHTD